MVPDVNTRFPRFVRGADEDSQHGTQTCRLEVVGIERCLAQRREQWPLLMFEGE